MVRSSLRGAAMRAMIATGRGGCILYTGSIHSHIASPNKSAYVGGQTRAGRIDEIGGQRRSET